MRLIASALALVLLLTPAAVASAHDGPPPDPEVYDINGDLSDVNAGDVISGLEYDEIPLYDITTNKAAASVILVLLDPTGLVLYLYCR